MRVTILSENTVPTSFGLLAEHGFSVLIERKGEAYLYDTGQHGIVVNNAQSLKKDLSKVEQIFLSHGHYDHANGLEGVLRAIPHPVTIKGHSAIFDKKYWIKENWKKYIGIKYTRSYLEDYLYANFELRDTFSEAAPGLYLSGEVPFTNDYEKIPSGLQVEKDGIMTQDLFPDDNSLFIDTSEGLVIVLGCAHRGMVNIVEYARKKLGKKIAAVIGGTHLHDANSQHYAFVLDYLKALNLKLLAPSHCTGQERIMDLKNHFASITQPAFCGMEYDLSN